MYKDNITPHLKALNWLPYEARVQFKFACITHKAIHYRTPGYLAQKITLSGGCRVSRSHGDLLLKPARLRKKRTYDRAFSGAAPRIWNALPPNIRRISSIAALKKEAKSFYMCKFLPSFHKTYMLQ